MKPLRTLVPGDIVSLEVVSDAQISHNGETIAFVVSEQYVSGTKLPKSDIWTVPTSGGPARRFPGSNSANTTPRWSPNGLDLAFLSDRAEEGQFQIYVKSGKGKPKQVTQIKGNIPTNRGLTPIRWSPDGKQIAFIKVEGDTADQQKRKSEGYDELVFERDQKLTRLYLVDISTGEVSCVSPPNIQVWEFCWAPSGQEFGIVTSDLSLESSWYQCWLSKFSLSNNKLKVLHKTKRQVSSPVWSPDGRNIAFLSSTWSDRGSVAGGIFVVPVEGGESREISGTHVASVSWLEWADKGRRLITIAHEQGSIGIAEVDIDTGARNSLWTSEAALSEASWQQFSRDVDGNLAMALEDDNHPRDIWTTNRTADKTSWRKLTNFNPQTNEYRLGSVDTIHWEGSLGQEIQGLIVRPPGSSNTDKTPMVTIVHGGPTSIHTHCYLGRSGWPQLLAANGMSVFLPNPRGSTGWGLDFAESNIGDMGGRDWEDIKTGIEYCIDLGIADPEKLGIGGWSYGGFMAAWAITQVNYFKAAMMGAGISDWRTFHGKSFLSGKLGWDSIYYGDADPWDPYGVFHKFSPINFVSQVKTPTLILHGEEDKDVPVEQGYLFYRALNDLGTEVQLVTYPREEHGPKEIKHVLDINNRILDWFSKHLDA